MYLHGFYACAHRTLVSGWVVVVIVGVHTTLFINIKAVSDRNQPLPDGVTVMFPSSPSPSEVLKAREDMNYHAVIRTLVPRTWWVLMAMAKTNARISDNAYVGQIDHLQIYHVQIYHLHIYFRQMDDVQIYSLQILVDHLDPNLPL